MGLFDYVKCEYPLPDPPEQEIEFQTKDAPTPFMDTYKIDKDGILWHENYDLKEKEMPPEPNLEDFAGCLIKENKRWEKCEYRGSLHFYGSDKNNTWHEYSALFDNGKLLNIRKLPDHCAELEAAPPTTTNHINGSLTHQNYSNNE